MSYKILLDWMLDEMKGYFIQLFIDKYQKLDKCTFNDFFLNMVYKLFLDYMSESKDK